MPRVLAIAGSPSRQSRSSALLSRVTDQLVLLGTEVDLVSLHDLGAEDLLYGRRQSAGARILIARAARADAIVLSTPVYKASFSGGLKTLLDLLPENALEDKFVLPLATGGSLAHVLALEYALKPVLSALGARHILSAIFAHDEQVTPPDENGRSAVVEEIAVRIEEGALHLHELLGRTAAYRAVPLRTLGPVLLDGCVA